MKAIVAVDLNWGIGFRGSLLERIPEDQKFFKKMTLGKVVVMGRETFESLPGKKPLKDRTNIVLSRDEKFTNNNLIICRSKEELFSELRKYNTDDIFVIGGESVYRQLLPYCTEAYVTKIYNSYEADRYFCNLDENESWEKVSTGDLQTYKAIQFKFTKYINNLTKNMFIC